MLYKAILNKTKKKIIQKTKKTIVFNGKLNLHSHIQKNQGIQNKEK
jgi:hypothetical protein